MAMRRHLLSGSFSLAAGIVRVGGFTSFLRTMVIPRLPGWRARYPQLQIGIIEDDDLTGLMRRLRRHEIDAVVVEIDSSTGEPDRLPAGVFEEPLLDDPWRLVVPSGSVVPTDTVEVPTRATGTVDLDLAAALLRRGEQVIGNDLELTGGERIAVITGPNEGGKTALARAYGQLHHLAALGLPVPGRRVRLGLCDEIFTHFERGENAGAEHGRLEDDILGMHAILSAATGRSVIVLNETFSSTTLRDAKALGGRILDRMIALGVRCVYVTFAADLADAGPAVVGLVSRVSEDDPAIRTYRVVRRPAGGPAYADLLARRYGLDRATLAHRIVS